MILLLIKQFWPPLEESMLLRLVLRFSLLSVKYFINTMVFLLASKKFHQYYHSDEMWKSSVDYLNRLSKLSLPYFGSSTTSTVQDSLENMINNVSNNMSICRQRHNSSMDDYDVEFKTPAICSTSTSSLDTGIARTNSNSPSELKLIDTSESDQSIHKSDEIHPILSQLRLQANRHKFATKRFRSYYRNSLFKVNLNETRASNESASREHTEIHQNGLPDLLNQKTAANESSMTNGHSSNGMPPPNKIPAEKSLDEVRFNEVEVPESLAKQLEYYDRDELLRLIAYQKKYLDYKESRIRDLENYIDNLVVKIIETEPSILMNASNILSKNIRI